MPATDSGSQRGGGLSGHAALVVVQFCFGLLPLFGKWAFVPGGFAPLAVASWRLAFGSVVFLAIAFAVYGRRAIPARRDLGRFLVCALLGVVLNQALFLEGLERSNALNAGLIMCLIPVFTFAIAALCGQERFRWTRAAGVAVALAGILPLFLGRGAELLGEHATGNLLMVVNTFCFSVYLVLSKPLAERYPALVVIAWVYALALLSLPAFVARAPLAPADPASARVWLSLAFILVFATCLGYLLNVFALARVRASTAALYIYLQPLISGTAAVLLLKDELTPGTLRAAGALFLGLFLVTRRFPERARSVATPAA